MFTVVAIGMNLNRPANIYNSLAISMFFLLLIRPLYLFDVGFQMSYTAVIAIASIKPLLASLWYPKWKLVNYFWQLICVTMAAQIGVVPISLFYFHQFPGLFFLSAIASINEWPTNSTGHSCLSSKNRFGIYAIYGRKKNSVFYHFH